MRHILFPTDLTNEAHPALAWVRLFANEVKASVTVLHVFRPMLADNTLPTMGSRGAGLDANEDLISTSRQSLEAFVGRLAAEGLVVTGEWRTGNVEDEILEAARERNIDLIITESGEVSTFFDRLAGSAATDVAKDAVCPVLYVPATNGLTAPPVLRSALYVMQQDSTQAEAARQTGELTAALKNLSLHYATLDQLDKHPVDLIIIMDYKRGGLFSGDPVQKVLSKAKVPVLVYHQPAQS